LGRFYILVKKDYKISGREDEKLYNTRNSNYCFYRSYTRTYGLLRSFSELTIMDYDTLHEIELWIIQQVMDFQNYAGGAFLTDDIKDMRFWKGQYVALEILRKKIAEKALRILVEEEKGKEVATYAEYVRMSMEELTEADHKLFEATIQGLIKVGWKEEGGSPIFRLLHKDGASIKVFRNAEAPKVIKTCWTAPPEEVGPPDHDDFDESL